MLVFDFQKLEHPKLKRHRLFEVQPSLEMKLGALPLEKIQIDIGDPEINQKLEGLLFDSSGYVEFLGVASYYQYQFLEDQALRAVCARNLDEDFLLIRKNPGKSLYYKNAIFYTPVYM